MTQPTGVNKRTLRRTKDWGLPSRTKGIGSGDAATILGISPWSSPFKLFLLKTGQIPKEVFDEDRMYWGRMLEPLVSQHWMNETGRKLMDRAQSQRDPSKGRFDIRVHPEHDWMIANLDYEIFDPKVKNIRKEYEEPPANGPGVYEGKTTSTFMKKEWSEDIPVLTQVQAQHEMACADMLWASVAVLIGGQEFMWKDIPRDDEFIALLIEQEQEFWENLLKGIPPGTDGTEATKEALRLLYPDSDGRTIKLSAEATKAAQERADLAAEKREAEKQVKKIKEKLDTLDNRLKAEIGNATFGKLADESGHYMSWKITKVKARTQDAYEFKVLRYHTK